MIIVFARAPLPGRVKTRLIPWLGAWGAARLQSRLTRDAVGTAHAARCGPVELHGTSRDPRLVSLSRFRLQRGAQLGERMYRALAYALRRSRWAILVGSDCPELRAQDLRRGARLLQGGYDAVLAPTEDGGYALIGLRRISPELFEGIAWGSPKVWPQTAARLARLGYRSRVLRTVWDVDRREDLERLRSRRFALASRRCALR